MACSISALFQLTVDKVLSLSFDLWKMIKKRAGPYRKNGTRQIIANGRPQYLLQTRRLFIAVQIVWIFICFSTFFSFVRFRTMCKLNSRFDLWPLTVRFAHLKMTVRCNLVSDFFNILPRLKNRRFIAFENTFWNIHKYRTSIQQCIRIFTFSFRPTIEILISD